MARRATSTRSFANGREYPEAYSATERSTFIEFGRRARQSYGQLALSERPSIDVFGDENYVEGIPSFVGRMCSAGETFVSMQPDGRIYRCEAKHSNYLGNILDASYRFHAGKSACNSSYCFYWCLKYADAVDQVHRHPPETPWESLTA